MNKRRRHYAKARRARRLRLQRLLNRLGRLESAPTLVIPRERVHEDDGVLFVTLTANEMDAPFVVVEFSEDENTVQR